MKSLAFAANIFLTLIAVATSSYALTIDEFLGDGVASSSIAGTPASAITTNAGAVGGKRALYAVKNSIGAGTTRLETFADPEFVGDTDYSLGYTQGAHTGQGIVTWDGDNSVVTLTPNGLATNGIDLTQDGGSAIQLGIKFFDYPASLPIDLTLRLYDASGISGLKYTDVTITLNQAMNFTSPFLMTIPFSRFTTSGVSTVAAPGASTFPTTSVFGPSGAVDITKVGAIQLIINGLSNSNAPDLTLDVFKTNGRCSTVPNAEGKVVDECGVCLDDPNANKGKDRCGVCLNGPSGYSYASNNVFDACNLCPGEANYSFPSGTKDSCGLCASAPNFNVAKDPCGVCFGDGTSCADCSGTPNGSKKIDICGVCGGLGTTCLDCSGTPFGTKGLDKCNVCGGDGTSCINNLCVTVQATTDILAFEKRLVEQTKTITKKYKDEEKRGQRNKCGINTKPSTTRVNSAYETIVAAGKDIFTKGVQICGDSCVTVSFADQVTALAPKLKIIENETTSLAKKVQACYKKKNIKTTQGIAGVATTIKNVQKDITQLVKDCKNKQVCPH